MVKTKVKRESHCSDCSSAEHGCFRFLPPEISNLIDSKKRIKIFKAGQTLFSQGQALEGVYCIQSGKVRILKDFKKGDKPILVQIASEGFVIGLEGPEIPSHFSYSAEAMDSVEACFVPSSFFKENARDLNLLKGICVSLNEELGKIQNLFGHFAKRSVKERLAFVLLDLGKRFGKPEGTQTLIELKISRQDLADFCGTVIESVSRALTELESAGVLRFEGRKIFIVKSEDLQKIAS